MNQPSRKGKLSKEEERQLIYQHKVKFEGPIPSTDWPRHHSTLFTAIRRIEGVTFDTYLEQLQSHPPHSSQKAKTINKVNKIVSAAYDCRISDTNEDTWRSKTEVPLLSPFTEDIECRKCKQRRWLPDFCAESTFPVEAQGTQKIGTGLTLCTCTENDPHGQKTADDGFAEKLHAGLSDPSVPEIGTRYPDHVIGLQRSPSLYAALQRHSDLVSGPVKDAEHILFPFLILEAKSEFNSPGFSAIEKQSAFPIKRLVDIQKSLRQKQRKPTERALVWFLAFSGDEWRVYACVPKGDETVRYPKKLQYSLLRRKQRIIDLWHGCILRHDCTLQLCLIVDLICDWAWNTYRKEIIQLLSVGPDIVSNSNCHKFPSANQANDQASDSSRSWKRNSVIRDTNEVFFSFRHLTLPESTNELTAILKPPGLGGEDVHRNASKLLGLFNLERSLLLPTSFITQLETLWTGANNKHPILDSDEIVFCHISFRSYFRLSDYHIMREISCITASYGAIDSLQSLSGTKCSVSSSYPNVSIRLEQVRPLTMLSGLDSLRAAARDLRLTLCVIQKASGQVLPCDWLKHPSQGKFVSSLWENLESCSPGILLFPIFGYSSELRRMSITSQCSDSSLQEFLKQGKSPLPHGAAILKTPAHLRHPLYPQYCLAVFDGSDLDDRRGLGHKLSQLITSSSLFEGKYSCNITTQDRQFIHDWATRLRGNHG